MSTESTPIVQEQQTKLGSEKKKGIKEVLTKKRTTLIAAATATLLLLSLVGWWIWKTKQKEDTQQEETNGQSQTDESDLMNPTEEEIAEIDSYVEENSDQAQDYLDTLKNREVVSGINNLTNIDQSVVLTYLDRSVLQNFTIIEASNSVKKKFSLIGTAYAAPSDSTETVVVFYIGKDSKTVYAHDILLNIDYEIFKEDLPAGQKIVYIDFSKESLSIPYVIYNANQSSIEAFDIKCFSFSDTSKKVLRANTHSYFQMSPSSQFIYYTGDFRNWSDYTLDIYDLTQKEISTTVEMQDKREEGWFNDNNIFYEYSEIEYFDDDPRIVKSEIHRLNLQSGYSQIVLKNKSNENNYIDYAQTSFSEDQTSAYIIYSDGYEILSENPDGSKTLKVYTKFGAYDLNNDTLQEFDELDQVEQFLVTPEGSGAYVKNRDLVDGVQKPTVYYIDFDTGEMEKLSLPSSHLYMLGWNGTHIHMLIANAYWTGEYFNYVVSEYNTDTREVHYLYILEVSTFKQD